MYIELPKGSDKILSSKGRDIIKEIGLDIIRGVVLDVLSGKNLRDSTELLTRKRIVSLNAATLKMMVDGASDNKDFIKNLPNDAYKKLKAGKLSREERWLMQWILGLNDKAFQNVLRDQVDSLESYKNSYIEISQAAIEEFRHDYGELGGKIGLNSNSKAILNWEFMIQLMTTIGAQTLSIRGSSKSTFGKLFEKLILGTLLSILGFKLVKEENNKITNKVFWLSSRKAKRESDATLLYKPGKGIRFDIGFIGRGNPEISLDKVSRFEREMELNDEKWYMATIIIVDRIGKNSKIEANAKLMKGTIVQMSGSYWPVQIAQILKSSLGYQDKILSVKQEKMNQYLKQKIQQVPFEEILDVPAFTETLPIVEESEEV